MTENQARQFLSKCEHHLLRRKVVDDKTVVEIISRNCRRGLLIGMLWLSLAAWNYFDSRKEGVDFFFAVMITALALLIIGFSMWILVRMRQVRQALGEKV